MESKKFFFERKRNPHCRPKKVKKKKDNKKADDIQDLVAIVDHELLKWLVSAALLNLKVSFRISFFFTTFVSQVTSKVFRNKN